MIYENSFLNQKNWEFLKTLKNKNKIPNALIFHGDEGVGKESMAIEFAAYINCHSPLYNSACNTCKSCQKMKNNNHEFIKYIFPLPRGKITSKKDSVMKSFSDKTMSEYNYELKTKLMNPFHKIHINGANTILINSIRNIKKSLYKTIGDEYQRIIIIFESEKLCHPKQEAANSLLKILEEPPNNATFILVTSKMPLLLETIKSRCIEVYCPKPSNEEFSMHNNSTQSSSINLYNLLNGNIKNLIQLTNENIDEIKKFITEYNNNVINDNSIINLNLITYIKKASKSNPFLFSVFIQALKCYYKDLMTFNLDIKDSNLTFDFLKKYYLQLKNITSINYINIIEQFEKDTLINLNLELSLLNLFDNLKLNNNPND